MIKKNPKITLDSKKPQIEYTDIEDIKKDLLNDKTARMIGLIAHLVYWNVFGHINPLPLDTYHKKLLFIQIAQIQSEFDNQYLGRRIFAAFHMPMLLLCIRIMTELIFKNTYPDFFSKEQHEKVNCF